MNRLSEGQSAGPESVQAETTGACASDSNHIWAASRSGEAARLRVSTGCKYLKRAEEADLTWPASCDLRVMARKPEYPYTPRTRFCTGQCSVRLQPQFGNSLNPRPLKMNGTHFSARAALVFACFADETWKRYDFLRPGVSVANADLRTALSSSFLCNSSGIGYSEGFLRSIFFPDSSHSMAS
jgi:hypothetical protein